MSEHARNTDPDTSHEAASSINISAQALRVLVSYYLVPVPLLDHTAYDYAGFPPHARDGQRCSDLRHAGLIEPTGAKAKTPSNRLGRLCAITDVGRRHIQNNIDVVRELCRGGL